MPRNADASAGWREERNHQGLENTLPFENELTSQDVSALLTDGGPEEEDEEVEQHMENDAWAAYHISEDLKDLYEDTGEYWVLEVSKGSLNPAFVIKDDEVVTHPDYDVENTLECEINGEKANGHPLGLLTYTGEDHLFAGKEFKTGNLDVPVAGDQLEEVEQYERLNGSYLAPGLADDYRESAEEVIDHFYSEEM